MKPLKAAAVVAGSMVLAGAAAPAFAADLNSLNGALDTISGQSATSKESPLAANTRSSEKKDPVVHAVADAAKGLHQGGGAGKLIGGLPLGK